MEELKTAGRQLRAAIDRYRNVCFSIHNLSHGGIRNILENHLDDIKAELLHFPSYEPKLRESWLAINKTHNSLAQLTPINSLPSEILTQIFHTVLASEPCPLDLQASADISSEISRNSSHTLSLGDDFPRCPDYLAHVCTHWRQLALSSPKLWVHIDFIPHEKFHKGLLARAEVHAARANILPLIVHLYEGQRTDYNADQITSFLASISHRMKALDFTIIKYCGRFTATVFDALLSECNSESSVFTQFVMTLIGNQHGARLRPNDDGSEYKLRDLILNLPRSAVEQALCHISVLQLRGIFLDWSSTVYGGLVDLRLVSSSNRNWDSIPESNLRTILESSPRLRVLHFALEITHISPKGTPVTPVRLDDLEMVNVSTLDDEEGETGLGTILRLLAPGSQPVQLSVWHQRHPYRGGDLAVDELAKFLQRSDVTRFSAKGGCPPLHEFLCYAPNLEDLILDSCIPIYGSVELSKNDSPQVKPLRSLIVHNYSPSIDLLEALLVQYPSKLLMVSDHPGFEGAGHVEEVLTEKHPDTKILIYKGQPPGEFAS
ncbi:unnamed protein product [Rhizoctonia solani]|uniref:F-box-like domain protein n=1 Tax=Rhizoctonia solani TaxID=456999 RepID=A0A8H3D1Y1_9AGAM|nr:unnamed protein product [Rhizoctonia solani]